MKIFSLIYCLFLFGTSVSFAGESLGAHAPVKESIWTEPRIAGYVVLGSLTLIGFDEWVHNHTVNHIRANRSYRLFDVYEFGQPHTFLEEMGNTSGIAGMISSFYAIGLLTDSESAKKTGVLTAQACAVTGVSVLALKTLAGRSRPITFRINEMDADKFEPFSGHSSFPSGHTATAFTMAAVISSQYPSWWVGFLSYGLASAIGTGRIIQDRHWTTDVIAGAAVGWGMGRLVVNYEKQSGKSRFLYATPNSVGIGQKF
ncbi:MAG: phosphatase PAP2 family protein [Elusimicrobia bacterium]|nr:phosphatase PAP2 family protein [Elusimicrobiota bacterium]